jgi:spore maturation protein CgeB
MMKILYVSPLIQAGTNWGFHDGFAELGHTVKAVPTHSFTYETLSLLRRLTYRFTRTRLSDANLRGLNQAVVAAAQEFQPDLIFYNNLHYITAETLAVTRHYGPNYAYFSDDMFNPANQTFLFFDIIRNMDCIFTTKSYNVREFLDAGAKEAIFIDNSYAENWHHPVELNDEDRQKFGGDVAFVGTFYPYRADFLAQIIEACPDIRFNIWGWSWGKMRRPWYWHNIHRVRRWQLLSRCVRGPFLYGEDMNKAIAANKICLGLLHKANRDLQTQRTMEIPAAGGFFLAERTDEHRRLFEEDKEAVYFSSLSELIEKIQYYLAHPAEREAIAKAGYERCLRSGYSYRARAQTMIDHYLKQAAYV